MAADTATNCTLGTGYDNTIMYNNHMNGSLKTRLTTAKKYASIDTTLTLFGKGGGRAMWPAGCNIKQEWCFGDIGGMRDGLRDGRLCRSMDTTQGWTTFNLMDGEERNWNNNWVVTQSVEKQGLKMRREEAVQQLTANNLLHQKGAIPAPPPKPPWPPPWHDEEPISEQICMEDAALVRHKYNWRCTQQSRPFVALSHNNNTSGYSPFRVVNWMTSTVEVVLQNHNNSDNILENGNTYCGEDSDVCSIYTKFILHNRGSESFLVRLVSNDCVDVSVSQAEAALSQAPPSDIGVVGPMV